MHSARQSHKRNWELGLAVLRWATQVSSSPVATQYDCPCLFQEKRAKIRCVVEVQRENRGLKQGSWGDGRRFACVGPSAGTIPVVVEKDGEHKGGDAVHLLVVCRVCKGPDKVGVALQGKLSVRL